ncbi:hypothetical protein OO013_04005 [Mangrovivirga sp. M17]|uniref:Uncharacterized protein n=1 Tax=Mangrovivirga halotolerans TaxID=2993936 RepID=A0ABT3RNB4_9BACT|nr:hypothetical protein [Mangrovivirga halotolerans]MCX2743013.1 hypothetical protein [Mangrovivirga halotolerans]
METKSNTCFPNELEGYISDNTLFLYSVIARDTIDYLGNKIFLVDRDNEFRRIENEEIPDQGEVFSSSPKETSIEIDSKKLEEFKAYLSDLSSRINSKAYETPRNIDIAGGVNKYVYFKVGDKQNFSCFEPDSDTLVNEIEARFNKIFE